MDPADRSRLLAQLRRQLHALFAVPLQSLFDDLDTRLFDLAERSRVGTQQQVFFEGLRECRRKRTDIEHDFLEGVADALRASGEMPATRRPQGLSLVGNEELEETLTLSAMADRTAACLAPALDALDQRLAHLLENPHGTAAPSRLSPQSLGTLFRAACQRLDVGIEVRLVAYIAFGHHVLDALGPIYTELNRELVAAGILPAIGHAPARIVRAPMPAAPPPRAAQPAPAPSADAGNSGARARRRPAAAPTGPGDERRAADAAMQSMLGELRDLLAVQNQRGVAGSEGGDPARAPASDHAAQNMADAEAMAAANDAFVALSSQLIVNALDRLHHFSDLPSRLKSELVETSRRLGADPRASLRPHDEDTVDLIGLVFDFVRHDPVLPAPLQTLLARLQVPFLKAALSDPELMKAADHPARRLIDDLGEIAVGWSPATDPEQQLLARLQQTVDKLAQPLDHGREPFERAIEELREHLEVSRHRAELAEQRAVEAALGRERLRIARSRVAAMLERRLGRYTPLPWIRQVLRGPWASYLVLLWLRHGESGEPYREGLRFVDELLWCDEHGGSSLDEARLREDEEHLDEQLRRGLSTVAYHDREIERLAGELRQFIASLRRKRPAPAFLYEIDPKLGTADFSQHWTETEIEDQPLPEQVDPAVLSKLRALPPGSWFEFGSQGSGERAKLSWTSPFSGRQLFVNRNGLRVSEIAPERLAEEIEQGLARMLETSRLLQRALQTLIARLRSQAEANRHTA